MHHQAVDRLHIALRRQLYMSEDDASQRPKTSHEEKHAMDWTEKTICMCL